TPRLARAERIYTAAQIRHSERQLVASRRRFSDPERDRRWCPLRISHTHGTREDLGDLPRRVAQLEDVASQALNRKVFVHRADERVLRLEDDAVVGDLWNGAPRDERQQTRSAPAAQHVTHFIPTPQR